MAMATQQLIDGTTGAIATLTAWVMPLLQLLDAAGVDSFWSRDTLAVV